LFIAAYGFTILIRLLFSTQTKRESSLSMCTEQSPNESDETICGYKQFHLLNMNTVGVSDTMHIFSMNERIPN
jgi:hypothetical protein